MRHRVSGRQLNRNSSSRAALFRSLAVALFDNEQIKTTLPKAKELRRVADRLITIAKVDTVANRRLVFARTRNRDMTQMAYVCLVDQKVEVEEASAQ